MSYAFSGYVGAIINGEVVVREVSEDLAPSMRALGFKRSWLNRSVYRVRIDSDSALPQLLSRLRDLSLAFAGASGGWPPAEIFDDLRCKGLVSGEFHEITWLGPGKRQIRLR